VAARLDSQTYRYPSAVCEEGCVYGVNYIQLIPFPYVPCQSLQSLKMELKVDAFYPFQMHPFFMRTISPTLFDSFLQQFEQRSLQEY
jgi:hypothetical protein